MTHPLISIVVCTHNRAESLRSAVASLYDLETGGKFDYEIVIVDNASTDETPAVIADAAHDCRHTVRGVYEPRKGIPAARNRGVHEAAGDWIAFFDDDQLAERQWLLALFELAELKQADAVGGPVRLLLPEGCDRNLANACRMLLGESDWSLEPIPYDDHRTPGAGNLMLRRQVFDRIGCFDEAVGNRGEDTDLYRRMQRANLSAWYAPQAVILHVIPASRLEESYLMALGRRMGEGVARYEAGFRSRPVLLARWLAKRTRARIWFQACQTLARLAGHPERALGFRCLLAISAGYHDQLSELLFPPPGEYLVAAPAAARRTS
jgi:glycosyltransferase involved in cell wall biosynthesis